MHTALLLAAGVLALLALPSILDSLASWQSLFVVAMTGFLLLNLWFARHLFEHRVFAVAFGVAVFLTVSLCVNADEIKRLANVWQIASFSGRTPWSYGHSLGLCLGLFALISLWKAESEIEEPGPPRDSDEVIAGPRLITQQEARSIVEDRFPVTGHRILWAGVELPESCGTEHFAIVGSPGSGKTLSLHLLMQSVLPRIGVGLNRRAIVYDAKRDTASFLAGLFQNRTKKPPVFILNPFDMRSSPWAMNQDIREGATAHEIASILITKSGGETQPFFLDASRALLGGVMHAFSQLAPDSWTLRDVVLTVRYTRRITAVIAACPQTHYLLSKYVTGAARDNDIEATIETYMRGLSFVAAAWHHAIQPAISLEQWMQTDSILVLGADPSFDHILQALNRAIFKRVVELTRRLPDLTSGESRQSWFIIDELRNAGNLEDLDKLLVEGRSKGACVVLGFQDLAGLRIVHGDQRADEIVGACANKVFLQNGDQTTIDYATKHFKTQDVVETRVSTSESETTGSTGSSTKGHSVSRQRVTRPVVSEGVLKSLPKPRQGHQGIVGYCDTSAVGTEFPYKLSIDHHFLDENLPRPNSAEPGFMPRPKEHLDLPEWDMDDLKRLHLDQFPELLSPDKPLPLKSPSLNKHDGHEIYEM